MDFFGLIFTSCNPNGVMSAPNKQMLSDRLMNTCHFAMRFARGSKPEDAARFAHDRQTPMWRLVCIVIMLVEEEAAVCVSESSDAPGVWLACVSTRLEAVTGPSWSQQLNAPIQRIECTRTQASSPWLSDAEMHFFVEVAQR